MSKLSQRFAAGKEALAARNKESADEGGGLRIATPSMPPRASGPLHGSVSSMKMDMMRSELNVLRASKSGIKLHPSEIRVSTWANRHPDSFKTPEFLALKQEIKSANGNIQPIKVRPLDPQETEGEYKYEIAYGHRRHRACLELNLDVNAIVQEMSPAELFVQMDRENRGREDLRPYEQGLMYARALDTKLFSSLRTLAEETGVDAGGVSKAISVARLPADVIDCFESPLDIQYRWAGDLRKVLNKEPDLLFARAADIKKLKSNLKPPSSQAAFAILMGKSVATQKVVSRKVTAGNKTLVITEKDKKISYQVDFLGGVKQAKIEKFIMGIMSE